LSDDIVLQCKGVHHWFADNLVLHDVDLQIVRGQIVALVGPSGCGKSTLLRAIVGTHPPRKGEVVVYEARNGERFSKPVSNPGRDRGIVYQRYSLFPNLTALKNVAFGLMLDETSIPGRLFRYASWRKLRREHLEKSAALLEKLGLEHAKDSYPHELSGGMRQRVAIAQALVMEPSILLLDEPFGALDESTREDLQRMLLELYLENVTCVKAGTPAPYTILMVTHELNEALFVSDRILGLSQHWDWQAADHAKFPGATIVYDHPAPVFHPEDERDYHTFQAQKEDVLRATFDPEYRQSRDEWRAFWDHVESGKAKGVVRR
jgi:NitT/TauT family transport system ATP-binding protein